MKKTIIALAVILLAAFAFQAQAGGDQSNAQQGQGGKEHKAKNPQEIVAELDEIIAKRQAELKEAQSKGRTEIASALQKLIGDLNNLKAAAAKGDKEAFKAANEQREKDREALEALRKSERPEGEAKKKHGSKIPQAPNTTP